MIELRWVKRCVPVTDFEGTTMLFDEKVLQYRYATVTTDIVGNIVLTGWAEWKDVLVVKEK